MPDAAQGFTCCSSDCGLQLSAVVPAHDGKTDMRACICSDVPRMVELTRPEGSPSDGANTSGAPPLL